MKGINAWNGFHDAGSDNLAMQINDKRCKYSEQHIRVACVDYDAY